MNSNLIGDGLNRAADMLSKGLDEPVEVRDFLDREVARSLREELARSSAWRRQFFTTDFFGNILQVEASEFQNAPDERRTVRFEKLPREHWYDLPTLSALMDGILSESVVSTLGRIDESLSGPPNVKVVRYGSGDFFGPHSDGVDGVALIIYLVDDEWSELDGGGLSFASGSFSVRDYSPVFNSAIVFRYRSAGVHEVRAVAREHGYRYTICADFT